MEWKELYADRGTTAEVTLCDGTTLWLNSGTKVIYPTAFDGDTRTIFIDGQSWYLDFMGKWESFEGFYDREML